MPLQAKCPKCQKALQIPDGIQGRSVRCPMCQAAFVVGAIPVPAPGPPPPQPVRVPPPPPKAAIPQPAPPPPPARPGGTVTPVHLVLQAVKDPAMQMKGEYEGVLSDVGVQIRQKGADAIELPMGTPVKYLKRNQIELEIDERPVQFLVKGFARGEGPPLPPQMAGLRVNRYRLAVDVAAFLARERREPPRIGDYLLPWYLFAVAALPMTIPIVTLGGMIPVVGALLLCGATFAIVQRDRWPVALRVGGALGISVAGYGALIGLIFLIAILKGPKFGFDARPTLPVKDWHLYKSPDGDFEVLLPGTPKVLKDPHPGVEARYSWPNPEITFRVHYFVVEPARQLELKRELTSRDEALQMWPELTRKVMDEYPESKPDFGGVAQGDQLSFSCLLVDSNRKRSHRVDTHIHYQRFGGRVYCATVSTIHTNGMAHDIDKFFKSVRVTYPGK